MLTVTGTIHALTPIENVGQKSTPKRTLVVETDANGQFPKRVAVELWKDQTQLQADVGAQVEVECWQPKSREYNGKWYTSIEAKSVRVQSQEPASVGNDADIPF